MNSAVSAIQPGPDGQLHRSWQPSAVSARSFVEGLNFIFTVLAQLNTAQKVVYRAVRKSYIINPTLARPRAGREGKGEGGVHDNGDEGVGITAISWLDTLEIYKSGR